VKILIVNVGSTSLKYKAFEFPSEKLLAQGRLERIGDKESPVTTTGRSGTERKETAHLPDYGAAIELLTARLLDAQEGVLGSLEELAAVGFKTVHAGPLSTGEGAKLVTPEILKAMDGASFVAPAHNPPYIRAIETFQEKLPGVPMVALFEPAFHTTMPPKAYTYAVPQDWESRDGIRHYGFHGASHRYIAERTPEFLGIPAGKRANFRLVSCHLGGSSSLCAIVGGKSVDTTMGYSPQSGLPQSSRCDTVDPFAVLYMMKERVWAPHIMGKVLCEQSGLKGISGVSGDMRDLREAAKKGNRRAQLAIDVFVYQVQKQIGAMAVAAGGVDAIVFTGGIGERDAQTRAEICAGVELLGVRFSPRKNAGCFGKEGIISRKESKVTVAVIPTNEEIVVARETAKLVGK
jgi:acetate kinase